MDEPSLLFALGAPLIGAAVLVVPPVANRTRIVAGVTIAALAIATLGIIGLFAVEPVVGVAGRHAMSLGPLDPVEPAAGLAWTLAPVLLGILFVGIAITRRHAGMIGLATLGLVLAAAAAIADWSGGEPRWTGGSLVLDPLAATLLIVTVGVGGLIVVHAVGYEPVHLRHRGLPVRRSGPFIAWLLLFLSSMQLLVLADDVRELAVGWELTTLCSFTLIRFDGDEPALAAADRALLYNLGGGAALALSALVAGPGARLSSVLDVTGGTVGPATAWLPVFLAAAIGAAAVKSALVPFHPWLLGAMVAAAPVSALLHASTMVNAGSYLVLRLSPAIAADGVLGPALAMLGGIAFAWSAFLALRERDLKRILALSTISTLGLMTAAAGLGSPAALAAGTMLLLFHAVAKALAFLTVGTIEQASATRDLEALVGLARRAPRLAGPLLVASAALALPPFGVAVAKWAILELGTADLALAVLLAAGATASVAVWTIVAARLLVRRAGPVPGDIDRRVPRTCETSIVALSIACVGAMLLAGPVMTLLADPAATVVFGTSPDLASGWSIALPGGWFAVPAVAALLVVAAGVGVLVARRIGRIAPAPYLSGATVGPRDSPRAVFHGARGAPVDAHSGGFYWGAAGDGDRPSGTPGLRATSIAMAAGWLAVGFLVAAALASTWLAASGAGR